MPKGERPRHEPEIIPPGRAGERAENGASWARVFSDARGTERVYIARVRPLGVVLAVLTTAIMLAVFFVLLLGALLFWLPLFIFITAGAIIAGFLRVYYGRTP